MKYSRLFKCGQWWLIENDDESKLTHNLGKCESWAQHAVDALNFQNYVRSLKSRIDKLDELDALDNCKAQKNVSTYNQFLCDIRDKAGNDE